MEGPERGLLPSNLDGRAFMLALAEARTPCHHVIMNLPTTAIHFLGAPPRLFSPRLFSPHLSWAGLARLGLRV